uniref:Uncharacterized protein n=1 Tax=Setaria italica TaxID=4555 RepID=K3Y2C4_SETIT
MFKTTFIFVYGEAFCIFSFGEKQNELTSVCAQTAAIFTSCTLRPLSLAFVINAPGSTIRRP